MCGEERTSICGVLNAFTTIQSSAKYIHKDTVTQCYTHSNKPMELYAFNDTTVVIAFSFVSRLWGCAHTRTAHTYMHIITEQYEKYKEATNRIRFDTIKEEEFFSSFFFFIHRLLSLRLLFVRSFAQRVLCSICLLVTRIMPQLYNMHLSFSSVQTISTIN